MRIHARQASLLVAFLALTGTGCGQLYHIKGKVTLDGQPLAGATVQFVPEDGSRPAVGTTATDGTFTLTTYKPGDGVLPGEYRVLISKMSEHAIVPADPNDKEAMKTIMTQLMKRTAPRPKEPGKMADMVPGVYSDRVQTPLRQTVPDPKGDYLQELTSKLGPSSVPGRR